MPWPTLDFLRPDMTWCEIAHLARDPKGLGRRLRGRQEQVCRPSGDHCRPWGLTPWDTWETVQCTLDCSQRIKKPNTYPLPLSLNGWRLHQKKPTVLTCFLLLLTTKSILEGGKVYFSLQVRGLHEEKPRQESGGRNWSIDHGGMLLPSLLPWAEVPKSVGRMEWPEKQRSSLFVPDCRCVISCLKLLLTHHPRLFLDRNVIQNFSFPVLLFLLLLWT